MPTLQEQSLVEKIITAPIRYKAVPAKQAISTLLKRKTAELIDLQEKAEKLSIHNDSYRQKTSLENEFEFIYVPEKEAIVKRIRNAIRDVQTSLDIVTFPRRLPQATLEFFDERMEALKRGVRIRLLSEELSAKNPSVEKVFAIERKAGAELRNLSNLPPAGVLIFDGKEVIIITSTTATLPEAPALWSNNPCLVALAQYYFDGLWNAPNTA
jgi:sugar-specific transcriptional regulator TrmB